ncbi:hypothetical protein G7Y79_00050g086150 [Physcia stellaris]|nr:hypothetical protein G7Y79_00050g086150 [Physcia stellaris]
MFCELLFAIGVATLAQSVVLPEPSYNHNRAWSLAQFSSLITFGDSYTDENRFNYFLQTRGAAPPPGTFLPEYTASRITLYNYAVSGAVCSNKLTPRLFPYINADFPSVAEYEAPAFIADKAATRNGTASEPYFTPALTSRTAVYALWIGTNDVGNGALLTDSQVSGAVLTNFTDCVFASLDTLYTAGARYLVLFNLAPLHLTPLYATDAKGGIGPSHAWPDKPSNHTAIAEQMKEYVTSINTIFRYQLPYEVLLSKRYPGARVALFDVYSLLLDIHANPTVYLNGTAPANVTGFEHHCSLDGEVCVDESGDGGLDSFMWRDELHPSEQVDRMIAREVVRVLSGRSKLCTVFWSVDGQLWLMRRWGATDYY